MLMLNCSMTASCRELLAGQEAAGQEQTYVALIYVLSM